MLLVGGIGADASGEAVDSIAGVVRDVAGGIATVLRDTTPRGRASGRGE